MFIKKRLLLLPTFCTLLLVSCAVQKEDGKTAGNVAPKKNEIEQEAPVKKASEYKKALISTEYGDMEVILYNKTPLHRDNFVNLAEAGYYDSLLFHRVINGFMIQGGDPESKGADKGARLGNGGPDYTIPAEFDTTLYHKKGALAAARMGDMTNPEKRSSGSQFYIVQGKVFNDAGLDQMEQRIRLDHPGFSYSPEQREMYKTIGGTPHLDMGYTVFGEVVSGINVIDSIAALQTDRSARPLDDVIMSIEIIE